MAMNVIRVVFGLSLVLFAWGGSGVEAADSPSARTVDSQASEAQANVCRLSADPNAWGPGGNAGWAREWLLGQCALAHAAVITYINLASECRSQQQTTCGKQDLLGACGPVSVALLAANCTNCQPACIVANARCESGVCSNTGKPCDNPEQCTFSKPVGGVCPKGSTLVENWAGYYALKSGGLKAPMTYCAWN